jgi:hypothetical protein
MADIDIENLGPGHLIIIIATASPPHQHHLIITTSPSPHHHHLTITTSSRALVRADPENPELTLHVTES